MKIEDDQEQQIAGEQERQKMLDKRKLGNRVVLARMELGLSREALAKRSDLTVQNLRLIENGNRFPSIEALTKICNALNTNPTYFMADMLDSAESEIYTRLWNVIKRATPGQAQIVIEMVESVSPFLPKREPNS